MNVNGASFWEINALVLLQKSYVFCRIREETMNCLIKH